MELARPVAPLDAQAILMQALRRVEVFERRFGIDIARIMVAPHGVCSRALARALVPVGFEAFCISRPYPWLARPPHPWLERPPHASPLTGWEPTAMVENGLPVLLRRGIDDPVEDLPLRAFLNQPLIIQAHHQDVRDGLDRLAEVADLINRLGDVQWKSLGEIARSSLMLQHDGDQLRVRLFTRAAELIVDRGREAITIELPRLDSSPCTDVVAWSASTAESGDVSGVLDPDAQHLELRLPRTTHTLKLRRVSRERVGDDLPKLSDWPLRPMARRFAAEARDRFAPTFRRVSLGLRHER
jgi:hypothetical protein